MTTFEEHLRNSIRKAHLPPRTLQPGECRSSSGKLCSLCYAATLDYRDEVRLKNAALQEYWREHFPGFTLQPLTSSPRGRSYRTTTKRKAFRTQHGVALGLIDPSESGSLGSFPVIRCAIEPDEHAAVYDVVQECLLKPYAIPLTEHLSYVIIRGSYSEFTLLFSVRKTSPELLKAVNTISKAVSRRNEKVAGVFVYEAAGSGRYYLESQTDLSGRSLKRIYGKKELYQRIAGRPFLYSPLSFSQINPSVVELMIDVATRLLHPEGNETLLDLYCGYGLFSLSLAGHVRQVVGVEASPESVQSAIANAKRERTSNVTFQRSDISVSTIGRIVKGLTSNDIVLLDPPRGGTSAGVIEAIAAREPRSIVHIFCNIEIMKREIERWSSGGYRLTQAHPFDMFPGTSTVETVAHITR